MNVNYSYPTTMHESISAQIYVVLVERIFTIFAEKISMLGEFTSFFRHIIKHEDSKSDVLIWFDNKFNLSVSYFFLFNKAISIL